MIGMLSTLVIPSYPKLSHPWDCGSSKTGVPISFQDYEAIKLYEAFCFLLFLVHCALLGWTKETGPLNLIHK